MEYLNATSIVKGLDVHKRILAKSIFAINDKSRKDLDALAKLVYKK